MSDASSSGRQQLFEAVYTLAKRTFEREKPLSPVLCEHLAQAARQVIEQGGQDIERLATKAILLAIVCLPRIGKTA